MSEPITKELREWVSKHFGKTLDDGNVLINGNELYEMSKLTDYADRIDAEHRRRMDDCRRNTKHALVRYLRGVLTDYDRGIKRVRKGTATEVVRCKDCQWARRMDDRFVCTVRPTLMHLVDDSDYCSRGVRAEVDE
jgi:hypothetical protein